MSYFKFTLKPRSMWRTAWQADTLCGALCQCAAYEAGAKWLTDNILDPARRGSPPFVLSDAFPGEMMPVPGFVRAMDFAPKDRKFISKMRWLSIDSFRLLIAGQNIPSLDLNRRSPEIVSERMHVMLDRDSDRSLDGALYRVSESIIISGRDGNRETEYLSVYCFVSQPGFENIVRALLELLAKTGFGADASTGSGQFEVLAGPDPVAWSVSHENANASVVISTFQPAKIDPVDGYWEMFVKYGKVGPSLGLSNVFKRPLMMMKAGATFVHDQSKSIYGRVIPADELLPLHSYEQLRALNIAPVQYAFGLGIPARIADKSA